MKKINNDLALQIFAGFDFKAKVKVHYNGMINKTYNVYEIVGTRVTIKTDRLIDFNINEVDLIPVGYKPGESEFIRSIYSN